MKKNKFVTLFLILITLSMLVFSLSGCSENEQELLVEKSKNQIKYLDSKIKTILNQLNNISINNYKVISEQTNQTKTEVQDEESSTGSNSETNNQDTTDKQNITKLTPDNVLNRSDTVNWENVKKEVEYISTDWATITLDLYKLNVNGDDILGFSSVLNDTIKYTKAEDKINTIYTMATLYSYLPKFSTGHLDEDTTNILYSKSYIYIAYSYIEEMNLTSIRDNLVKAEEYFSKIVNNVNTDKNQYNINKTYILLKEFQNSIDTNDKDILYIKYKNLIQEIDLL